MALWHAEREYRAKGLGFAADFIKRIREEYGDVPLPEAALIHVAQPELALDLKKESERQAGRLADLFAKPLGLTRQEYLDTLPKLFPQPESYKGRFNIPLLVQPEVPGKLPLSKILEITGVYPYLKVKAVKAWEGGKVETPSTPYSTWVHDGKPNLYKSVDEVRSGLKRDERGGRTIDGIALLIQKPDVLKDYYIDFPGDQVGSSGNAPFLDRWGGKPNLNHSWTDLRDPSCGSLVAGAEIKTRPENS